MLRATLTAAALTAASLMPLAAQAQATTEVTMLGRGYFPNKINVDPGGSIVFHNASDVPMAATALDDSWTTGWVFPGNRKTIVLPEEGGLVFNNRINALDALLGTEPEFFNEAMIITDGSTEDLLSPAVEPLDTDTLLALYGPPNFDTDGDGDLDGYDWSEILVDPEDRPWAAEGSEATASAETTDGGTTEQEAITASN
ncbi:hypothetical protein FIU97_04980 [Roseivivax sp. THAF40]|uniref:hypothetical protein n=1 Tax=unclassified Roseivivax TaxID=2639302 RepID=UPI001268E6EC|nr:MULTISPECIES: hypothetical protein [unclassified Roseivivax]QFS82126.1 hypothetical protein FIV09_04720 [Roseivivax sp. THAF197b]QFT45926.1 hypothetical protein FIU97_04980 [Roseivivax sp. THAF40]